MLSNSVIDENTISAEDYRLIVKSMYPNASKTYICHRLGITRPTHNHWLVYGITRTRQVQRIRNIVGLKVTDMRQRARALDKWTTSHTVKPVIPRLTYEGQTYNKPKIK